MYMMYLTCTKLFTLNFMSVYCTICVTVASGQCNANQTAGQGGCLADVSSPTSFGYCVLLTYVLRTSPLFQGSVMPTKQLANQEVTLQM